MNNSWASCPAPDCRDPDPAMQPSAHLRGARYRGRVDGRRARRIFERLLRRLQTPPGPRRRDGEVVQAAINATIHEGGDLRIAALALQIGEHLLDPFHIRMTRLHGRLPRTRCLNQTCSKPQNAANRRMRRTSVRIPSSRDVSRRTIDVGNGVKKRFRVSGFTLRDLASIGSTIVSDYGLWYDAAACARVRSAMNYRALERDSSAAAPQAPAHGPASRTTTAMKARALRRRMLTASPRSATVPRSTRPGGGISCVGVSVTR